MTDPAAEPNDDGPELRPYPIQLRTVFCVEARAERKTAGEDVSAEPAIEVELSRTGLSAERNWFSTRVTVDFRATVSRVTADCHVVVQGDFISGGPISDQHYEAFVEYTPVALLWPYARAYLTDLSRMLGVSLPPLPTLHGMAAPESLDAEEPEPPPTG